MYNQLIPDEFLDYLVASGYRVQIRGKNAVDLYAGDHCVAIKNHTVTFWQYIDGDDDTAPDIHSFGGVQGIDQLDFFGWQLLLHAFGLVPLQEFVKRVRKEEPGLFEQLTSYFNPNSELSCKL